MFIEILAFNADSVDPDPTPRSAASDPGLYCLPMSRLWDAKIKWIIFLYSSQFLTNTMRLNYYKTIYVRFLSQVEEFLLQSDAYCINWKVPK